MDQPSSLFSLLSKSNLPEAPAREELLSQLVQNRKVAQLHPSLNSAASPAREPQALPVPTPFSNTVASFLGLAARITEDLQHNLPCLLSLNPSRREMLIEHLNRLMENPSQSGLFHDKNKSSELLRKWIEGPRTPAQNRVLQTYFQEVALVCLGQAVLLKTWSDRNIRAWNEADLSHMNWVLSHTLKPSMPMDREGWQITRPNLYSWYTPGKELQKEIWKTLNELDLSQESAGFLSGILRLGWDFQPDWPEFHSYDQRFFQSLWNFLPKLGIDFAETQNGPIRRKRMIFSPTLRDGSFMRCAPAGAHWIGLESYPFQFMIAEMCYLWAGPTAPPLWMPGSGLEVHSREQLTLNWSSPKPTVGNRLADIEACDLSIVLEERKIVPSNKNHESSQLKLALEKLEFFKKVKSPTTSLGNYQALVAIQKLRPGGYFLWAREQRLGLEDGSEMLRAFMDRAKLVAEWDFTAVEHSLPLTIPLFPKVLYLFQKETQLEKRRSHRPKQIGISGTIRSHVEVPLLVEDALQALLAPEVANAAPKGHWKILSLVSPVSQMEWLEKWPEPGSQDRYRKLERLQGSGVPLGQIAQIKKLGESGKTETRDFTKLAASLHGFFIKSVQQGSQRKLRTLGFSSSVEVDSTTFLVTLPNESWVFPLRALLESEMISDWLEFHTEREGGRWLLQEQNLKFIPISRALLTLLQINGQLPNTVADRSWEKLGLEVAYHPAKVLEEIRTRLNTLEPTPELARDAALIRSYLFVHASQALQSLCTSQGKLFSLVGSNGNVVWHELLAILPKSESLPFPTHPKIKISGSIPMQLPISQKKRVLSPIPGIFLCTEAGMNLTIASESEALIQILWEQIEKLEHPTLSDLSQNILLPKNLEFAHATASDILRSYADQNQRKRVLIEVLSACLVC